MVPRDFSVELRRRLAAGATLDDALGELRAAGASIIDCIATVRSAKSCDLAEAKHLVESSMTWAADVKLMNDQVHADMRKLSDDDA